MKITPPLSIKDKKDKKPVTLPRHGFSIRFTLLKWISFSILFASALFAQTTHWTGDSSTVWRNSDNWNAGGVPTPTTQTILSSSLPHNPYVPVPDGADTASTAALTVQSGANLYFDPYGVLTIYGGGSTLNDGFIRLGSGTMIFKNTVGFNNGGTLEADSGNIVFEGGSWTNNSGSTFSPGTSTVTFDGDSVQTFIVNGVNDFIFYNLVINTQGTVSIQGNVIVSNDCYLAAGCTLNVASGYSFQVQGSFSGEGTIVGSGSYSALPIELTSLTSSVHRQDAVLQWTTATEVDNFGFGIERRLVNSTAIWTSVGFVQGFGTSTSPREYLYTDNNLQPGRYAYRLKQIDKKGSFRYYSAAEVVIGSAPSVFSLGANYPNPFNPSTTIEFTIPTDGRATLKVFNLIGQEVANLFDAEASAGQVHQVHFNASSLPSGLYFYRLQYESQSMVRPMSLVK